MKTNSKVLWEAMEKKGYSQIEVSKRSGVKPPAVNRLVNTTHIRDLRPDAIERLKAICTVLGVDINDALVP